jgi:hypothetical protein
MGRRAVIVTVGLLGLITLPSCSTGGAHLSGLAKCEAVYHSKTSRPATPPSVERLSRTMRLDDILMQPISQDYAPTFPASLDWRKSGLIYERMAHYRVVLATVTTPSPRAGSRELLDHQPAWVVLATGAAGPFTASVPAGNSSFSPPACIFYNTGFSVMDANTGQVIVAGG